MKSFLLETRTVRFKNDNSLLNTGEENSFELDVDSSLSSSTELETHVKHEEEKIIRRSKRRRKTNPIVRYNNPVCHDYRNHSRKAELGRNTGSNRRGDMQPQLNQTADNKQTSRADRHRDRNQCGDRLPVHKSMDHWRDRHTETTQNPIGQSTTNSVGGSRGHRQSILISLRLFYSCIV